MAASYLIIGKLEPGLFAVGEDLPQDDSEAPHVALSGELAIHDALRRHPADGKHGVTTHLQHKQARR